MVLEISRKIVKAVKVFEFLEKVLKVSERVFQVKSFGCDCFVGFWKDFKCLKEGFLGFEGILKGALGIFKGFANDGFVGGFLYVKNIFLRDLGIGFWGSGKGVWIIAFCGIGFVNCSTVTGVVALLIKT